MTTQQKILISALLTLLAGSTLTLADSATPLVANAATTVPISNEISPAQLSEHYGQIPLSFEANRGQAHQDVNYLSRGAGYTVFLTPREAVLALTKSPPPAHPETAPKDGKAAESETAVVRLQWLGAAGDPDATGLNPLPGKSNYLYGNDPKNWHTDIPQYEKVRYANLYPGIDLVYYGNQRQLEYDFIVQPGADPKIIQIGLQGADKLALNDRGDLILHTRGGELVQHKPVIYQEVNGARKAIDGGYVLNEDHRVAFQVASYDKTKPLIIDPVLGYSTYLGGNGFDNAADIAVDNFSNVYIIGTTDSYDLPTRRASYDATCGTDGKCNQQADTLSNWIGARKSDVYVIKLHASGTRILYATYIGGSNNDQGVSIALDGSNNAYITGQTSVYTDAPGGEFPATPGAYDTTYNRDVNNYAADLFVAKLNSNGSALVYSTYLGSSAFDAAAGIAVDALGNAYVSGTTYDLPGGSNDFPTTATAYDTSYNGAGDTFITKLNPAGTELVYSTYVGGIIEDDVRGIAIDAGNNTYVTGTTGSLDYPTTTGAYSITASAGSSAFITKLNSEGSALMYSTYLGGSGDEIAYDITVDKTGHAYVTGSTTSTNFPRLRAAQITNKGGFADIFLTKLSPAGDALVYSTYWGGSGYEHGSSIALNFTGQPLVTGTTYSTDFPTTANALDTTCGTDGTCGDAFIIRMLAGGYQMAYSSYWGGSRHDQGHSIVVDRVGSAYIAGTTDSTDLTTTEGAYDRSCGPGGECNVFSSSDGSGYTLTAGDAFITKVGEPGKIQFTDWNFRASEGAGFITAKVFRSGGNAGKVTVDYASSDGTATAGVDYTPVSGTLIWNEGETGGKNILIPIINDTAEESTETVKLVLSNPTGGAVLGALSRASGNILNDDL